MLAPNSMTKDLEFQHHLRRALFAGIFCHFLAVIFSEGFHRPDEHLGIMRYVSLKLGRISPELLSELSWEYPAKIRSWLQPGLYYVWSKLWELCGIENPFSLALLMRLLSSSLSFFVTLKFVQFTAPLIDSKKWRNLYPYFAYLLWFFPFFHARTTAENFGANALMLSLIFLLRMAPREVFQISSWKNRPSSWSPGLMNALLGGLFLGLAVNLRVPLISIIPFVGIWAVVIARTSFTSILLCLAGILMSVGLTALTDYWGYGSWTYSTYNYFWWEFTKDVSTGFGVDPWWKYLSKVNSRGIPPIGSAILISFLFYWFKRPWSIFTWVTAGFFLAHSAIGHKELRYIFPLIPFIPFFLCLLFQDWEKHPKWGNYINSRPVKILFVLCLIINFGAMAISSLRPAYAPMPTYKFQIGRAHV